MNRHFVRAVALGASLAVHACALAASSRTARAPAVPRSRSLAEVVVADAAPKPSGAAPPAVTPPVTPRPEPRAAAPRAAHRAAAPAAPPAAPAPAEVAASPLPGTTLATGDGSWASAVGDGSTPTGPIGPVATASRPAATSSTRAPTAGAPDKPRASEVVAASDLSRKPQPPRLDEALRRNYPPDARAAGIAGQAVVRAEIGPDGRVRAIELVSESRAGFGAACRATLSVSRWSPPLDVSGRAVATRIRYRCAFEVAR